MTLSRRKTLALIGGGSVLAATASVAGFAATRRPARALEPWDSAGRYDDPRTRALSYALLAPNPHNRQPWLADLGTPGQVAVFRDPARDLPVTDPHARQLTIGMGCFPELMDMAAAEDGFGVQTELFPEGDAGPVALCRFVPGAGRPDRLFAQAMDRRSHKGPFDPTPLSDAAVAPLQGLATVVFGDGTAQALRAAALAAWLAEAATPAAWQESVDLLRIGKAEINASPDGIYAGGARLEALALAGLFTHAAAADTDNPGTRGVIARTAAAIETAPGFVVQTTPGNARRDQIAAGRAWLRLNLATTAAGLALRPVSQALQEYAQVAPMRAEVHRLMAGPNETVQMLGLLGYARPGAPSPRWPLETRLTHA